MTDSLPDYLRRNLDIVSVGLNPSLPSVAAGFYFANPRNRFWPALNASGLVGETLEPGKGAMERLFTIHGIGFTDVVKRATPGGAQLRAVDFRRWAPVLHDALLRLRPRIVWFHGKVAYRNYLRYGEGATPETAIAWGKQAARIVDSVVFVTPNPSPANAAYSLDDLARWYRRLGKLRDRVVVAGPGT